MPECLDVIGPAVAVVKIVCVLPYIARQERSIRAGQGRACIAGVDDIERLVRLLYKPRPARPKVADRGFGKRFPESRKRAPFILDSRRKRARRLAAALR